MKNINKFCEFFVKTSKIDPEGTCGPTDLKTTPLVLCDSWHQNDIYFFVIWVIFINGIVPIDWLNLSIETFKVRCKGLFLWYFCDSNRTKALMGWLIIWFYVQNSPILNNVLCIDNSRINPFKTKTKITWLTCFIQNKRFVNLANQLLLLHFKRNIIVYVLYHICIHTISFKKNSLL